MKLELKLAAALKTLAAQGSQVESTASGVLAIVKSAGAINEATFDGLVEKAYEANGWNPKAGRPANGSKPLEAAPDTVRVYVTIVRRAIRLGLRVGRYDTFTALRTALERKAPRLVKTKRTGRKGRKGQPQLARIPKDLEQNFVGVEIETPREPNGALFHDLAATFVRLKKEEDRAEMGREIAALLHRWLPKAGVASIAKKVNGNGHVKAEKQAA